MNMMLTKEVAELANAVVLVLTARKTALQDFSMIAMGAKCVIAKAQTAQLCNVRRVARMDMKLIPMVVELASANAYLTTAV